MAPVLAAAGLPASLADALDDPTWDAVVQAETDEALALAGKDVGTPILQFVPPDGPAFFGPVISRLPGPDEAEELWDHVVALARFPGFAELKRSLRELPQLRALGVAEDEVGRRAGLARREPQAEALMFDTRFSRLGRTVGDAAYHLVVGGAGPPVAGLGHERFAVVGHDRGARVGYRMALDHPEVVERLAVLNVIPTLDQFARMSGGTSLGYWPWVLLAQPAPMPERLLGADPAAMLDHVFATWPADPAAIPADHRAAYLAAMTPRRRGRDVRRLPGELPPRPGPRRRRPGCGQAHHGTRARRHRSRGDPARRRGDVWREWAAAVTATTVPGGHFVPEESPAELLDLLCPSSPSGQQPSTSGRCTGSTARVTASTPER